MQAALKKEPKAVDTHVGARIRSRRLMLDLSQTKLADALGLTFQQVQKYEKGTNRVGASRLAQIAETLQVPVSWFFDGAGAKPRRSDGSENAIDKFIATSEGVALVRAFTAIPDAKVRRAIVELVQRIAES
jgi:transcriptional regulator with XRE-family HTH domain